MKAVIIPVTPFQQNSMLLWCTETAKGHCLGQVTLSCSRRTEQQHVPPFTNELTSGQLEDWLLLDRRVEREVEVLKRLGVPERSSLYPPAHESLSTDRQLIFEDQLQELHVVEPVAGSLLQSHLQR